MVKISGPIQLERPPNSEAGVRVFFACRPPVDSGLLRELRVV